MVEFHSPSGEDGRPLYTTPQERDAFCFSQGYSVGYAQGKADTAQLFMDEAEDAMRRAHRGGAGLLISGMCIGAGAAGTGWFVVAPLLRWLLS